MGYYNPVVTKEEYKLSWNSERGELGEKGLTKEEIEKAEAYKKWYDNLTDGKRRVEDQRVDYQKWYDSLSKLRKREVLGHLQYQRFFEDDWCTFSGFYSGDENVDYDSKVPYGHNIKEVYNDEQ